MKLHQSSGTCSRSVSLLDLEDEGATVDPIVPMTMATVQPTHAPARVVAKVASAAGAASSIEPSKVLESIEGEKTRAVATAIREDSVEAAEILMGDDTRDDGQHHFEELGGILLPHPLDFQGPDIDPYLP